MMQAMSVTTAIQNSTLRELRTALEAWRKAEYSGGRERAAQFLASVASDLLTGIGSIDGRAEPQMVTTTVADSAQLGTSVYGLKISSGESQSKN